MARDERARRLRSATVSGGIARRFHGLLIAALPAPLGRIVMLNDLDGEIERADGSLATDPRRRYRSPDFTLSKSLPSWRWELRRHALNNRC